MKPDIKILVVKDDAPLRLLIEQYLKAMGFTQVLHENHGATALDRLSREEVDFIISDWQMPVLDGVELFKILKSKDERRTSAGNIRERYIAGKMLSADNAMTYPPPWDGWKNIPFLMITSNQENVKDMVAREGIENYLTIPFTRETFSMKFEEAAKAAHNPRK